MQTGLPTLFHSGLLLALKTIANMTTEWGAMAGIFPVDTRTLDWYDQRLQRWAKRTPTTSATSRPPSQRVTERTLQYVVEGHSRGDAAVNPS